MCMRAPCDTQIALLAAYVHRFNADDDDQYSVHHKSHGTHSHKQLFIVVIVCLLHAFEYG